MRQVVQVLLLLLCFFFPLQPRGPDGPEIARTVELQVRPQVWNHTSEQSWGWIGKQKGETKWEKPVSAESTGFSSFFRRLENLRFAARSNIRKTLRKYAKIIRFLPFTLSFSHLARPEWGGGGWFPKDPA